MGRGGAGRAAGREVSWVAALAILAIAIASWLSPARGCADDRLLPEWPKRVEEGDSKIGRAAETAVHASYEFVSDTLSDTWSIAKSPLGWRTRGWLTFAGVAGATTGLIFLADDAVHDAAKDDGDLRTLGRRIRFLGNGPGLAGLTGGFAAVGLIFQRDKELETARLLLEASAIGYGFTLLGKYSLGRSRPRAAGDPERFRPFSGSVSMPSGEATSAFVMAGVVTSQYPSWYVQILAYGAATTVGVGRIGLDAHWTSDVFLSAALGIGISKAVVHLHRRRRAREAADAERGLVRERPRVHHSFQLSTRSVGWTVRF